MMNLSPLNQRRIANFKANKRGYYALWLFLILFIFRTILICTVIRIHIELVIRIYLSECLVFEKRFFILCDVRIAKIAQLNDALI